MEQLVTVWQAAMGSNPDSIQATAQAGADLMLATLSTSLGWCMPNSSAAQNQPDFALISLPQGDLLPEISGLAGNNSISTFKSLVSYYNNGLPNVAAKLNSTTVYTLSADAWVLYTLNVPVRSVL